VKDAVSGEVFGKGTVELVAGPRGRALRLTGERPAAKDARPVPGLDLSDAAQRMRVAEANRSRSRSGRGWSRARPFASGVVSFAAPEPGARLYVGHGRDELVLALSAPKKGNPIGKAPVNPLPAERAYAAKPNSHSQWVHVAITRDARGRVRCYADGELIQMGGDNKYAGPFDFSALELGRSEFEKLVIDLERTVACSTAPWPTTRLMFLAGRGKK